MVTRTAPAPAPTFNDSRRPYAADTTQLLPVVTRHSIAPPVARPFRRADLHTLDRSTAYRGNYFQTLPVLITSVEYVGTTTNGNNRYRIVTHTGDTFNCEANGGVNFEVQNYGHTFDYSISGEYLHVYTPAVLTLNGRGTVSFIDGPDRLESQRLCESGRFEYEPTTILDSLS